MACKADVHVLRIFSPNKCVKKALRVHVTEKDNTVLYATSSFDQLQEKEALLLVPGS